MKLKEIIRQCTREHLNQGGMFFGQCVTAVGWIGGTVPEMTEDEGIVELPTSDSSNSAVVCGAALAGKRPIYTVRYQGFMAYNAASLFNYAAKSLEMWGVPCPIFIRAIGMEGSIGPVASGTFHSLAMHNPGILVSAPITPKEWMETWIRFKGQDSPLYCSEHRKSFDIDYEIEDEYSKKKEGQNNQITIFGIGIARLEFEELKSLCLEKNIEINTINIFWLKPLIINQRAIEVLKNSKFGIVVDSSYTICGVAEHVAYQMMLQSGKPVHAMGLNDRTSGFGKHCDNLTPDSQKIFSLIKSNLK